MSFRWFFSRTVRQATRLWKQVRNILNAQRDLLSEQAIERVTAALAESRAVFQSRRPRADLEVQMKQLEATASQWLKPYPHAGYRENFEVFLVAIAVAMAVRTFFVQPFKIPTGSMQPTLFGVTSTPDFTYKRAMSPEMIAEEERARDALVFPTGWPRIRDWFAGISYLDIKAKTDGVLQSVNPPVGIRIFNFWQTLTIGGRTHLILFPPDYGQSDLRLRAGLEPGQFFRRGETVVHMKIQTGDHLFVDRMTYNFRPPKRGEIVVFQTAGIRHARMPQDQFYIKRLVALGGERVQIGDDRHLRINGRRLDKTTPHFENVYSFDPHQPPAQSEYSGHVNDLNFHRLGMPGYAPLFPDGETVYTLPPDAYMVMGDNTLNSFDSRAWGTFPADNVIGKQFFVYWPITKRFGWHNR
ncbi:MAG TPA: signal peptidase I [Verrucomicrobiota bacterium]|nr:signal peptidase I [Verrucomicrobiota bacterium]HNT15682.1 signal peptidase I [Verrucomicrobiota bacterium]